MLFPSQVNSIVTVLVTSDFLGDTKQLVLRPGQLARVGSSDWVELSVQQDSTLCEHHFVVDYRGRPKLKPVEGATVFRDGQPVYEAYLSDGEQFMAGGTRFSFALPQAGRTEPLVELNQKRAHQGVTGSDWKTSDLASLGIEASTIASIVACQSVQSAVAMLSDSTDYLSSVRLIAAVLPKIDCVAWVRNLLGVTAYSHERTVALDRWLANPNEISRRGVAQQMHGDPQSGPEWLLQAIVWTGGTLVEVAPGNEHQVAPVIPPNYLCALACSVSVQLSVAQMPDKPFPVFINAALPVLDRIYPMSPMLED